MPGRFLIVLVILCSAGHFLYAALTYGPLPDNLPIHFTHGGLANGFAARSWMAWMALPGSGAIASGISVLIGVGVMTADTENLRLPNKEQLMALPAAEKKEALATFARPMILAGAVWVAFFWTLQREIYRVAIKLSDRLDATPLFIEIGLILFLLAFGTAALSRKIRALTKPAR